MNISRHTLANGLRIVHHRDPSAAMVAVNVLYAVGARDESPDMTGIAHLFEHLMFGGSVNIPDFDGAMERAGGSNNAWTSNDFTNFYDVVPAHNAETAFWLESDRMLSPAFTDRELEVQKGVVIEEFKQVCLNQPYGDLWHHLRSLAYKVSPYRWPVIGMEPAHILSVTTDDARKFFANHYSPRNAILAITGNITDETAFRLAEKWFIDIPAGQESLHEYPVEPEQTEPRELTVTGNVPSTTVTMVYKMGGYKSPQYRPADILTDILASGQSSRFYRELLLKTGLFTEIDASILGSEGPGLLVVNGRLAGNSDYDIARAKEAINRELKRVVNDGVTDFELQRAVNRFESENTINNISYLNKASQLALAEYHGEDFSRNTALYRSLTVDDINTAAREILNPDRCSTLIYRPSENK